MKAVICLHRLSAATPDYNITDIDKISFFRMDKKCQEKIIMMRNKILYNLHMFFWNIPWDNNKQNNLIRLKNMYLFLYRL